MVGNMILPDITEILRDPCSSCAIRSASSIKSIPKPCIHNSILFSQLSVRCANLIHMPPHRWHCTMHSKGSLGAGTWWGLVHSQAQHCHTCYFLSSHNLTMLYTIRSLSHHLLLSVSVTLFAKDTHGALSQQTHLPSALGERYPLSTFSSAASQSEYLHRGISIAEIATP